VPNSDVERQNLMVRRLMRWFIRVAYAFSKKFDNHVHASSLYFVFYNFGRIHKTRRMSSAIAVGLTDRL
jgi:hypothetical protein